MHENGPRMTRRHMHAVSNFDQRAVLGANTTLKARFELSNSLECCWWSCAVVQDEGWVGSCLAVSQRSC